MPIFFLLLEGIAFFHACFWESTSYILLLPIHQYELLLPNCCSFWRIFGPSKTDFSCIRYRWKLFLGYSVFKLVYFFSIHVNLSQPRSICFKLDQLVFKQGQLVSTQISLGQVKNTSNTSLLYQCRNYPNCLQMLTLGLRTFV